MTPVDKGAVCIAYIHQDEVAHSFHKSMMEMFLYDIQHYGRFVRQSSAPIGDKGHGGDLEGARNRTIEVFLKERTAEWLLWVDTDMGFAWDSVERLLEVADPVERPIVGALCFAWREVEPDGMSGYIAGALPTIFKWDTELGHFVGHRTYSVNTLVRCHGTGSAFVLVHRSVFERMLEAFGPCWYERVPDEAEHRGWIKEDLAFCIRANALDIPIHVHTGVKTNHLKPHWVQEFDFWTNRLVPPADERVTVIVPVLGRPQNAERFMRTLRASTGMADVIAAVNPDAVEDMTAWAEAGAETMWFGGDVTTFAQKINNVVGTMELSALEPHADPVPNWILVTGDDVHFHPGWLDQALDTARRTGAKVIGTQDLGNPRVLAGEHATHLLISTEYIREQGASWDGPGIVCHEGYRHWFVDDEIVLVAKQRGVWAFSPGSIIEHLHPLWEKGELDATYELGQSFADEDAKLWRGRVKAYGEAPDRRPRLRMGAGAR